MGGYTPEDYTPGQWKYAWDRGMIGQNTGMPLFPPSTQFNSQGVPYNPERVGRGGVTPPAQPFPRDSDQPAITPASYNQPPVPQPPARPENISDPTPPVTPGQYSPVPWGHPQVAAVPPVPRVREPHIRPTLDGTLTPPPDVQPPNRFWNPVAPQQPFADQINRYSHEYGIPPNLLSNLLRAESGFDPRATGPMTKYGQAGGIAQFIPATAARYHINPYDPDQAIRGAAEYLRDLYNEKGSWAGAVAAYNGSKSIDTSQYRGSAAGRALIANAVALDGGLVKAGPLVPPPQNYRPESYGPNRWTPDRPPSQWGRDTPDMFSGIGAIPHQREIPGIMKALAPLLMVGLSIFSKGAALPMLSFYGGYLKASAAKQDKDAKELKTKYQDQLKELKAKMGIELAAYGGAGGDMSELRNLAVEFGDQTLLGILDAGKDPGPLLQQRDRIFKDTSKTDLAERRFELSQQEFLALEEQRNAQNERANAKDDRERKAADEKEAAAKKKAADLKRQRDQLEHEYPGSTLGGGGGDEGGDDGDKSGDGGDKSGGEEGGGGQRTEEGGGGEEGGGDGGGAPAASPAASPTPSVPQSGGGAAGTGAEPAAPPSTRWGPGGPPKGYNPKDDPLAEPGASAAPSAAPAAPPRAQPISAPGGEDQVIPPPGAPRLTPAADVEPAPDEGGGRPPAIPPVPSQPSQASIEDAENNTFHLARTFLHGGESPPGMRPGVNQAAETVANDLRTKLNGLATAGVTGKPLIDAIRKIDNRTADMVDQVSHNRAPLPGGSGMGSRLQDYSQMIAQLSIAANPNWDAGQWTKIEDFRTPNGQTQRAIGRITAIGDAGTKLQEDLKAIKDDPTIMGRMLNQFRTQGFTDDPAYSNLFTDWQTFIIDSNALTQGGQGLEGETEQMIKSIPLYGQKSAYTGALKRHASFALKRYEQYKNQWGQLQRTDPMFGHNDEAEQQLQTLSTIKEEAREKLTPSAGWGATGAPQ